MIAPHRLALLVPLLLEACHDRGDRAKHSPAPAPAASRADTQLQACRERILDVESEDALPGAPAFERRRAEIFGRARGEPLLFVREPAATRDSALPAAVRKARRQLSRLSAWRRVRALRARFRGQPRVLRALMLRQGYLYSSDPIEALALVTLLRIPDLFAAPDIVLERGSHVYALHRAGGRHPSYRFSDGREARLLFGDRLALKRDALGPTLHRDLRTLAHRMGFDRARIEHIAAGALVARLRLGTRWVRALLVSDGARLSLSCLDAPASERRSAQRWQHKDAPRRRALARLRGQVTEEIAERLPFDRPRGEETEDEDGQLRPAWRWAYRTGQRVFSYDDRSYPVYDVLGRPHPPQVCVEFVLDSYERASGTWFASLGHGHGRIEGRLDFKAFGIENRSGVLAFEHFAEEHPELFAHRRFRGDERIEFRERRRFFAWLVAHADLFKPGDIVAIRGLKADGRIHQHALLIEDTDPETGFPDALADQMSVPRRRTWENIMGPASRRSLYYRVRPSAALLDALAGDALPDTRPVAADR